MREYLDSTKGRVQMALLSACSPDLNPVEYLWAWLKRHALANFLSALADRTQNHRTQQAAKRPAPTVNHHCVLEASRAVVMSWLM